MISAGEGVRVVLDERVIYISLRGPEFWPRREIWMRDEDEGVTWVRGLDSKEAAGLLVAHALRGTP